MRDSLIACLYLEVMLEPFPHNKRLEDTKLTLGCHFWSYSTQSEALVSHPLGRQVTGLDDGTAYIDYSQQGEAGDEEDDERYQRTAVAAAQL